MLRHIQQRTRMPEPRPTIEEYAASESRNLQKSTGWSDFDFSFRHFMEVAKRIWGDNFDINGGENELLDKIDPIPQEETKEKQTIINQISRAESRFRDEYIVGEIEKSLGTHKKIFIVYGRSHAVIQEPALREIFK